MVVIAFIVWDGIKKVRDNRGQALDIEFEPLDSDTLHDQLDSLQVYDEFEIDEALLKGALKDVNLAEPVIKKVDEPVAYESKDSNEPIAQPVVAEETIPTMNALEDFPLDNNEQAEASQADLNDEPEPVKSYEYTQVDEFEHFSAHADDPILETVTTPIVKKEVLQPAVYDEVTTSLEDLDSDLEDSGVPVLMEPVALGRTVEPNPPKQHELHLPEFVQQTLNEEAVVVIEEPVEDELSFMSLSEETPVKPAIKVGERLAERPPAQEVFVINVVKKSQPLLQGFDLNRIFQACDLRFGEMDIFHRFEKANAQGKIQFSVVNSLNPGTFDLETINDMQTSGISFFMSLPGPENPMEAFNAMAETAMVFSRNFNAILHDESHSDLNPQTLEHYRQRIRDYSRKHLSKLK